MKDEKELYCSLATWGSFACKIENLIKLNYNKQNGIIKLLKFNEIKDEQLNSFILNQ